MPSTLFETKKTPEISTAPNLDTSTITNRVVIPALDVFDIHRDLSLLVPDAQQYSAYSGTWLHERNLTNDINAWRRDTLWKGTIMLILGISIFGYVVLFLFIQPFVIGVDPTVDVDMNLEGYTQTITESGKLVWLPEAKTYLTPDEVRDASFSSNLCPPVPSGLSNTLENSESPLGEDLLLQITQTWNRFPMWSWYYRLLLPSLIVSVFWYIFFSWFFMKIFRHS